MIPLKEYSGSRQHHSVTLCLVQTLLNIKILLWVLTVEKGKPYQLSRW